MVTDNFETDEVFNKALVEKTSKKRSYQGLNLEESVNNHDKMVAKMNQVEKKRDLKALVKKFRPFNFDLRQMNSVTENYKTLLGLGFLDQRVLHS